MRLTHYFPNLCWDGVTSDSALFATITEYAPQEQKTLATQLLRGNGRALRRFDHFDDYIQKRTQTERWLYSAFLRMGGRPCSCHPYYFILGESERLKCDFGPNAREVTLDTSQINASDISFTLGDSVGICFSASQKRIYALSEIEPISLDVALVKREMAFLEEHHRYIEAQLWNKRYLNFAEIV